MPGKISGSEPGSGSGSGLGSGFGSGSGGGVFTCKLGVVMSMLTQMQKIPVLRAANLHRNLVQPMEAVHPRWRYRLAHG